MFRSRESASLAKPLADAHLPQIHLGIQCVSFELSILLLFVAFCLIFLPRFYPVPFFWGFGTLPQPSPPETPVATTIPAWGWRQALQLFDEVRQDPGGHRQGGERELIFLPDH